MSYDKALELKSAGELEKAAQILEAGCATPHITKGWYRELFSIWRKMNRRDLKRGSHEVVIGRVLAMLKYDAEMIATMLSYWGKQQNRDLPADYFDNDRNLRVSDTRALLTAATALSDAANISVANRLLDRFGASKGQNSVGEQRLEAQCASLGLELIDLPVATRTRPEEAVLRQYSAEGYVGTNSEGGAILTVIKALALDVLTRSSSSGRQDTISWYLEAQLELLRNPSRAPGSTANPDADIRALLDAVRNTTRERYLANASEILQHPFIREIYPGLGIDFMRAFELAVRREDLVRVTEKILQDPYKYRKGWPDLTLVKKASILFVEVKTTDKLRSSQIETIPAMRPLLGAKFMVVRLR